jgi:hypothetical protein
MTDKEVMQMALDLEKLADRFSEGWHTGIQIDASDVMLLLDSAEALAQPEPKPESGLELNKVLIGAIWDSSEIVALPQREWQGLTDDERVLCEQLAKGNYVTLCAAIEAKLKEKNNG